MRKNTFFQSLPGIGLVIYLVTLAGCAESISEQVDRAPADVEQKVNHVTIANPTRQDIAYVLTALGSVESLNDPTVAAEITGQVTSLNVDVGSRVAAGDELARIDDALYVIQLAEAAAQLKRQNVVVENQRSELARLRRLAKSQALSRDRLEDEQDQLDIELAQRDVAKKRWEQAKLLESKTRIIAPQPGIIAQRHVSRGDYVSPGQALFDLVAVDRLRARLSFSERDASRIKLTQQVVLTSPAAPDAVAKGTVTQINPRIDAMNRAIEIMVEFDNPGGWFPGASVDASLIVDQRQNALTVPRMGVVERDGKNTVFLASGNQSRAIAKAREVELGWSQQGWIEIVSGLTHDERIVVEGASLISDGSLLQQAGEWR